MGPRPRQRAIAGVAVGPRVGYDYVHVAVDDHPRLAFVEVKVESWPDEHTVEVADNTMASMDVAVLVSTAYHQWTHFDPAQFTEGMKRIDQVPPTRTHWVAKIAGVQSEFDAKITVSTPISVWRGPRTTVPTGLAWLPSPP